MRVPKPDNWKNFARILSQCHKQSRYEFAFQQRKSNWVRRIGNEWPETWISSTQLFTKVGELFRQICSLRDSSNSRPPYWSTSEHFGICWVRYSRNWSNPAPRDSTYIASLSILFMRLVNSTNIVSVESTFSSRLIFFDAVSPRSKGCVI